MKKNPRLVALESKRDGINTRLAELDEAASLRDDAALTDDEREEYGKLVEARDTVSTGITELAERMLSDAEVAQTIASVVPAESHHAQVVVRSEAPPCTPGEYASLLLRASINHDADAQARLETLMRAAGDETTTEGAGVIPTLITGDVVKFIDSNRYAWNVSRQLPMPQYGSSFKRPRVTQFTQVGAQSSDLAALPARSLTLTGDSVTKATAGGFVHIGEQVIDWSDPAFLQIVLMDLAQQYAIDTEGVVCAAIVAAATNTVDPGGTSSLSFDDTPAHFIPTLAAAVSGTYSRAKKLPDVLFAAPDVWGALLAMLDLEDRPVFPTLSPMNAIGTLEATSFAGRPMALQLVVSPSFDSGFCAVGCSQFVETYEQDKGLAQVNDPQHLGLNIAYRGYVAANVYANGLTALVDGPAS